MKNYIHIKTSKFPALESEIGEDGFDLEDVQEMFGESLCIYLKEKLNFLKWKVTSYYLEDWGYWLQVESNKFNFGLLVYSLKRDENGQPVEYAIGYSLEGKDKKWSWSKFRFIKTEQVKEKIINDLIFIFEKDEDVEVVEITEDFPYV